MSAENQTLDQKSKIEARTRDMGGLGRDREARNDKSRGLPLDQKAPNQPMAVEKAGLVEGLKYVRRLIFKGLLLPYVRGNQPALITYKRAPTEEQDRHMLYRSRCEALFEHVYESYRGDGESVYRDAA